MTNWTKQNIPDLNGKVFIATGANSGLGYESSLALAEKGATVIMVCRNLERAQRSLHAIKQTVPSAKLELMELDLASLQSIGNFAKTFQNKYDRLDVLINKGTSAKSIAVHPGPARTSWAENNLDGFMKF
jgi:NAD(P)-dependent dehydrogenase (short-subunit alcohol dehydrogenase family)